MALFSISMVAEGSERVTLRVSEVSYERTDYKLALHARRYQPTRPNQLNTARSFETFLTEKTPVASSRSHERFEPTRPQQRFGEAWLETSLPRYEPTRPSESNRNERNESSRNYVDTISDGYEQWKSVVGDYEKVAELNKKGKRLKKMLLKPVKLAFKISKKTISKVAIKSWIPIL